MPGCGSGNDESSPALPSDSLELIEDYETLLRPQIPSRANQIERLQAESIKFETRGLAKSNGGGAQAASKNFAGAFLGFLGSLVGLNIVGDALDIDFTPPGPIPLFEPDDFSFDVGLTPAIDPEEVVGFWSGELTVTIGECGPQAVGETRRFDLVIQQDGNTLVVLDQDGFVYTGEIDLFLWDGWWSDDTGSISTITLTGPHSGELYVTVHDSFNIDGNTCEQKYWGELVRTDELPTM